MTFWCLVDFETVFAA